jgi:hypothetical protein
MRLCETVDLGGELEVRVGETTLGVRGEGQADLVPAVHENIGVVVSRLCDLSDAVNERERCSEVREGEVAHDPAVPICAPVGDANQSLLYVGIIEQAHGLRA